MKVSKRKNKDNSIDYGKRFRELLAFLETNKWLIDRVIKPLPNPKLFKNCKL